MLGSSTTVMLSSVETNWANVVEDQSTADGGSNRDTVRASISLRGFLFFRAACCWGSLSTVDYGQGGLTAVRQ
jgi:hypothetical protein